MSGTTLALFSLLTFFSFIGLILFWGRLGRSSFRNVTLRISSLLIVNLLFIGTLGLVVNNYGGFYGSWSELLGIQKVIPSIPEELVKPVSLQDLERAKLTPNGSAIIRNVIKGSQSQIVGTILTVLPPSYVEQLRKDPTSLALKKYRAIEFLSGFPGSPTTWLHGMNLVHYFEQAQMTGAMPPTIAVLPQINILPHRDTECLDVPNGPQIETWLSQDVVTYEKKFLLLPDERWGVTGYSTGGWCTAMLTLRNPQVFLAGVPIAAYFEPQFSTPFPAKSLADMKEKYDIKAIATSNPPSVNMLLINSPRDASSSKETIRFAALLKKPVQEYEITLLNAGHNLKAWQRVEPTILQWFGKVFKLDPTRTRNNLVTGRQGK